MFATNPSAGGLGAAELWGRKAVDPRNRGPCSPAVARILALYAHHKPSLAPSGALPRPFLS